MLLRGHRLKAGSVLGAGQLCLVAALLGQRFLHPPGDFWQGFAAGFCGVLVGVSIVLNVRGLVLARQQRSRGG